MNVSQPTPIEVTTVKAPSKVVTTALPQVDPPEEKKEETDSAPNNIMLIKQQLRY